MVGALFDGSDGNQFPTFITEIIQPGLHLFFIKLETAEKTILHLKQGGVIFPGMIHDR